MSQTSDKPHIDLFTSMSPEINLQESPILDSAMYKDSELDSPLQIDPIGRFSKGNQNKSKLSEVSIKKTRVNTLFNENINKSVFKNNKSKLIPGHQHYVFDEKNPDYTVIKDQFTKTEIKEAFDYLAMTNGKFITIKDLEFFLDVLEEDINEEDIREMIRMCDFEGNNQVRYEEFEKMATGQSLAPIGQAFPPTFQMIEKKKQLEKLDLIENNNDFMFNEPRKENFNETIINNKTRMYDNNTIQIHHSEKETNRKNLMKRFVERNIKITEDLQKKYDNLKEIDENLIGECDFITFLKFFQIEEGEKNKEIKELSKEIFNIFVENEEKTINLKDFFISLISVQDLLNQKKLLLCFNLLDEENSGYLTLTELIRLLRFFQMDDDIMKTEKKIKSILKRKNFKEEIISKEYFFQLVQEMPNIFLP